MPDTHEIHALPFLAQVQNLHALLPQMFQVRVKPDVEKVDLKIAVPIQGGTFTQVIEDVDPKDLVVFFETLDKLDFPLPPDGSKTIRNVSVGVVEAMLCYYRDPKSRRFGNILRALASEGGWAKWKELRDEITEAQDAADRLDENRVSIRGITHGEASDG